MFCSETGLVIKCNFEFRYNMSGCHKRCLVLPPNWWLPRGISLWPWQECTGSRSSGESSRHSFHRSASQGGSWARKWHLSFSAPHAKKLSSCAACSCTGEPLPSACLGQLPLKDTLKMIKAELPKTIWLSDFCAASTPNTQVKSSYLLTSCCEWMIFPAWATWVCIVPPYPAAIALAPGTSWPPPQYSALPQCLIALPWSSGLEGQLQGLLVLIRSADKST